MRQSHRWWRHRVATAAASCLCVGAVSLTRAARLSSTQNLPPEWERILNESGITAAEQEDNAGTVIQVLNAAANLKTKGLG